MQCLLVVVFIENWLGKNDFSCHVTASSRLSQVLVQDAPVVLFYDLSPTEGAICRRTVGDSGLSADIAPSVGDRSWNNPTGAPWTTTGLTLECRLETWRQMLGLPSLLEKYSRQILWPRKVADMKFDVKFRDRGKVVKCSMNIDVFGIFVIFSMNIDVNI